MKYFNIAVKHDRTFLRKIGREITHGLGLGIKSIHKYKQVHDKTIKNSLLNCLQHMQETPLHPISLPIQRAVHLDHPKGKIIRKRLLQTLDGLEELFPKLEQYSDNEKTKETITYIQEHFTNYIDLETE